MQRQLKSACVRAVQQAATGGAGFGGVTAGLHAMSPLIGTWQIVCALENLPIVLISTSIATIVNL